MNPELKATLKRKYDDARPREAVTLPDLGLEVEIVGMGFGERRKYDARTITFVTDPKGKVSGRPVMELIDLEIIRLCTRLNGEQMFDGPTAEADIDELLTGKDAKAIVEVGKRLSGLDEDAVKRAEGNSDETPGSGPLMQ